ncbi:MAG: diacylglycerol kinase family protein [Bacteroidota bacterium]
MSVQKRIKSFGYAFRGIASLVRSELHARIHLTAMVVVILAGIYFGVSPMEWAILSLTIAAVLAAEGFNTAIEALTDLVSPDYHTLAGKAKDVAAGAVLLLAIGAIGVAISIFGPKIWALFL